MKTELKKVEYKVRPVVRYIVTKYQEDMIFRPGEEDQPGCPGAGSETCGEFDSPDAAYNVAYALCRSQHDASGLPIDSDVFIYPEKPSSKPSFGQVEKM